MMTSVRFRPGSTPNNLSMLSDKLVLTLQPDEILQLIKDLSGFLNDKQKENLLEFLTTRMKLGHLESLRLTSRLHSTCRSLNDCFDFVAWLPPELVMRIFTYLPWKSLMACSLVNRNWFRAARHPELYRRLCQLPQWCPPVQNNFRAGGWSSLYRLPPYSVNFSGSSDSDISPNSDPEASSCKRHPIDWFEVFRKRARLRRNWLLGRPRTRRFTGHSEAVYCVAYDAYRIVSGSADATIRIWNVRTNANWSVQTLRGHSDAVRCIQLLPLSSPSQLGSPPSTPDSPSSPLTPVDPIEVMAQNVIQQGVDCWQPPEALLISGSADTTLKVWRLSTAVKWSRIACISTLQGHTSTVRCVQADEDKVISGSYDCTLRLWDLHTSQLRHVFRGHSAGVVCLDYDEHLLYSGSLDNTVRVWCLSSGVCLYSLLRSSMSRDAQFWLTPVSSVHLDPSRRRLLIAHHDGVILTWHIPPPEELVSLCSNHLSDNAVQASEPVNIFLTEQFGSESTNLDNVVRCLAGDAWHIVCGSDDKTLKVWRADNDRLVSVLRGHEDGITCAFVTASVVVSGSYDKSVILYDFDLS
ncbi:unnamed protein product [Calicophoron daubneyi]|uniref:F-box domain-containing protein n=1 Tax=Calicophoron daubneyi TaxID=300641 RepID=A0AAV2TSK1_CALDB